MIFEIIISFFIAAIVSFAGSLQLGPVNTRVIQTAVNFNLKTSVWVAIGGSIPEIIYCAIAFRGSEIIIHAMNWLSYFQIAACLIFLWSGIAAFRKPTLINRQKRTESFSLLSGFFLGMLNPMLIGFWISIITFLHQFDFHLTAGPFAKVAFVAGAAVGAFFLLYSMALLVTKNKSFFEHKNHQLINKIVGFIFIILAIIQFLKLIL